MSFQAYLNESLAVLQKLSSVESILQEAVLAACDALKKGKSLLVCGNGGSASDAQHITGELVGRYLKERRALKAICLSDNAAVLTALANDYGYEYVFSRQVEAYGEEGGVLIGLSTSGRSPNVIKAFEKALEFKMTTISFTGEREGPISSLSTFWIPVASSHTPIIQQAHFVLYHFFCQKIEEAFSI